MLRLLTRLCALLCGSAVLLIALFILLEGWPILPALAGTAWDPEAGRFGALALLAGSLGATAGALLLAVPAGVAVALFLTEVAPPAVAALVRPTVQALAGVPSVIYGFLGLSLLVPLLAGLLGGPGFSLLAGALVLAIMVLPTVAALSEEALRALPPALKEGALALGATPWQAVSRLLLPSARQGLTAAVLLGFGRALGETMAVLMVTGNVAFFPRSPLDPVRTLTGNIALEMAYAVGQHRQALFAAGGVLLILVLLVNSLARSAEK